jgi:dipeptidyl aminopeptidase/acylaminoacyl peptidase
MHAPAAYNATPLIPRSVLFGNPEKASPQISPDGKKLAYIAPSAGVLNVWICTLGADDERVVTHDAKRGIRMYFWQQDSAHIIFLQDQDGDEEWHIYQTDISSLETRDLTPFSGVHAQVVGSSPDYPETLLVGLNVRNPQLMDVYRVNLMTGESELDTENPGDVAGWTADNSLQVRAAQSMLPDGSTEIRLRDTVDRAWESFLTWGPEETFGGVAGFTPNNDGIRVLTSLDANAARIVEIDIKTREQCVIASDNQYDVTDVMIQPRKHTLQAVAFLRARLEWLVLDDAVREDFEFLTTAHPGDLNIVCRDLDDTAWIVAYVHDDKPTQYYLYIRSSKSTEFLFTSQPALESYALASMQPVSFEATDGMTLYGYLSTPVGVEPKDLPLVLLVHGGPWHRDTWGYNASTQHLVNRGYAVLAINFRGSTGYGKAYLNAGNREWAGKMHSDLIDGKRWAIEQGVADPERVAIMGGSYGGYATLVGLTFTPTEFVCGVDIVGPSNLITLLESFPPYWKTITAMMTARVGDAEKEQDFLKSRSPLFLADQIVSPLLIGQGANDPRVKQAESDQIVEAMRKNGKPVEYILFPDEGHGFARPENRMKFCAATEVFLAKYLGGRYEPVSEAENADELRK